MVSTNLFIYIYTYIYVVSMETEKSVKSLAAVLLGHQGPTVGSGISGPAEAAEEGTRD